MRNTGSRQQYSAVQAAGSRRCAMQAAGSGSVHSRGEVKRSMQDWLEGLGADTPVATHIISIALMLTGGFLMTRVTKKLKLPNVTAYILSGILMGPFVLDLIPSDVINGTAFLPDIALSFIAFSTGEFFRMSALRKNGGKVAVITLSESCMAAVVVFAVCFFVLKLDFAFCVVLGALATATAPASTIMTIRQTGAKGDFVETLLQVVAFDDVVGLVLYSISISLASASLSDAGFQAGSILIPLGRNLLGMAGGGIFGLLLILFNKKRHSTDNRLIIAVALLFGYCGFCAALDISPLLGCMLMGTVYINISGDEGLFRQLNYFSPPILLLFFVRSGISFNIGSLFGHSESIGHVPLLLIGILYFALRIAGKYIGAWIGCRAAGKPKKVCKYLGLALIPQAGVAIGLAALGAREIGGEMGNALETIILSSSVLYELIGPGAAKLSLYLSGSYSNSLEDIAPVEENTQTGQKKTEVELLIERIRKIQEELPKLSVNENEQAFDEAAREYRRELLRQQVRGARRRRRPPWRQ